MEFASLLAGEQWSDHPACTHPVLAQLARGVNDYSTDAGRQELLVLIPSVVGRRGDDLSCLAITVAVAASTILDVPEPTQRVLAGGLLQAEQLCADAGRSWPRPGARPGPRSSWSPRPSAPSRARRAQPDQPQDLRQALSPTMLRCTIEGTIATGRPDRDQQLRHLLEVGIAVEPERARGRCEGGSSRRGRWLTAR